MTLANPKSCLVLPAIAIAALVIALTGCGSSGDGTGSSATVSKAQFIKQADATCLKVEKKQHALVEEFSKRKLPKGRNQEIELIRFAGLPPVREEVVELRELPLPSVDAKQAEAYLDALETAVDGIEKDLAAFVSGEGASFKQAEALATKYGFKVCKGA